MVKPLSNKKRIFSLTLLIIIFLLATPFLIFYSLGYRVSDIDDVFTLEKTGGIYIHSNISNTEVYLDGKFNKTNGVLLRNTLIQNLKPEINHKVEVHKEGYQSWTKELPVYSSLVTEGRVLMLPKEIPQKEILPFLDSENNGTTTVPKGVKIFKGKPVPTNTEYKNTMILFEGKDIYSTSTPAKLITNLSNLNATSTGTTTKEVPEYFVELGIKNPDSLKNLIQNGEEVSWLENGNVVMNWVGKNIEIPYYYCLEPENCSEKITLDWKDEIKKFDFLPGRNDVFLVLIDSGLYAVEADDRSERNVQAVYVNKIDDFLINSNNKIIIRESNRFFELTI